MEEEVKYMPLKEKYRVRPETKKGTYKNRTGNSNGILKNRNKFNAKQRAQFGIVPPVPVQMVVKNGKRRFVKITDES